MGGRERDIDLRRGAAHSLGNAKGLLLIVLLEERHQTKILFKGLRVMVFGETR